MQDIYDQKCKNIKITDEHELQFRPISLFNREDIDQGNLVRRPKPKKAVLLLFLINTLAKEQTLIALKNLLTSVINDQMEKLPTPMTYDQKGEW